MAQSIAVAGWQPISPNFETNPDEQDLCGHVIALTKNITRSDLVFNAANHSQEPFARLFVNSCLWAARLNYNPNIWLFSTGDTTLNTLIVNLLQSCNCNVSLIQGNWYDDYDDINIPKTYVYIGRNAYNNSCYDVPSPDLYIFIPNTNALLASPLLNRKMDPALQSRIYTDVTQKKSGLLIGEWFHFLHSQINRHTFYNESNPSQSLYLLSPLIIPNAIPNDPEESPFVFVDTDNMYFNKVLDDDTMSNVMPSSFELQLSSTVLQPYNGEYTNIFQTKPSAKIFWTSDVVASDVIVTTTTPAPVPITLNEIKMKVAEVNLVNICGPHNMFITGKYSNYFKLEGNVLYLIREPENKIKMDVTVVVEDHFRPKRFQDTAETYIVNFDKCDAPITAPLDGSGPVFSFRDCSAFGCADMWGSNFENAITVTPFEDWTFTGEGTEESPVIATIGGQHCDINVLWMQLNTGGTLRVVLDSDSDRATYCPSAGSEDIAYFYVIKNQLPNINNTPEDYKVIKPEQHYNADVANIHTYSTENSSLWPYGASWTTANFPALVQYKDPNINNYYRDLYWSGKEINNDVRSFQIEDPNELDTFGNRKRGDAFLVVVFKKKCYKSEYQDRIRVTAYFGNIVTTTPAPKTVTANIKITNKFDKTILNGFGQSANGSNDQFIIKSFTQQANSSIFFSDSLYLYVDSANYPNIGMSGVLTITNDDSDPKLISSIIIDPNSNVNIGRDIYLYYNNMPNIDKSINITIDGVTVTTTTTTTTTCPPCPIVIKINNNATDTLLSYNGINYGAGQIITINTAFCQNVVSGFTLYFSTQNSKIYYPGNSPSATVVSDLSNLIEDLPIVPKYSNNTSGYVYFTVQAPNGCNQSSQFSPLEINFSGNPTNTTTTTTTLEPIPCNNEIEVLCKQTLKCSDPDQDGVCTPNLTTSFQELILVTCCNLTYDEQLQRVFAFFGQSYTSGVSELSDIPYLLNACKANVTTTYGDCAAKDLDGNCNDTILTRLVSINLNGQTAIVCNEPQQNPLP